jgi:transcriptional regulator with XRE-family HTH domain
VAEPGDSPTVARLRLGARLKALRTAAGMTGVQAGAALHATGSKISRMESGEVPLRVRDVEQLLRLYGEPPPAERDELLGLARESTGPGWWDPYSDSVSAALRHCLEMEAAAGVIATYDSMAIPALLQTDEYAAAVAGLGMQGPAEWRGGLNQRTLKRRRSLLDSRTAPQLWALVDAAVFQRTAGDRGVMAEQMRHLVELAQAPSITVQIVPAGAATALAASGPFSILRFPARDLPDVVFLELLTAITCLAKPRDVDRYWRLFNLLAMNALSVAGSLTQLREMGGTGPTLG